MVNLESKDRAAAKNQLFTCAQMNHLFTCAQLHEPAPCHAPVVPSRKPSHAGAKTVGPFNAQAFLDSSGVARTVSEFGRGESVFTQGDVCDHVMYIQSGGVKLSVMSKNGREAVVAMLGPGDFFGEGRSEEHTSELQSLRHLVCRLLLE